jgi:hypothetical protein
MVALILVSMILLNGSGKACNGPPSIDSVPTGSSCRARGIIIAYLAVGAGAGDIVAFVGRHAGGKMIKVVVDDEKMRMKIRYEGAGYSIYLSFLGYVGNCDDTPLVPPTSLNVNTVLGVL